MEIKPSQSGEMSSILNTTQNGFAALGLNPNLLRAIESAGYSTPTPVQELAIPAALLGKDLLASAQTGTGKTAAFVLPILERFTAPARSVEGSKCRGPRALILTPTRELAVQITKAATGYGKFPRQVAIANIVGGMPYFRQRKQMSGWVDIMVATPGRLIDFMQQGEIDFRRLEVLVLDEADRMLDMGFRDAVFDIVKALPEQRQTLLFSATLDRTVIDLAQKILKDPVRVEVAPQRVKHEQIDQFVHYVADHRNKQALLAHLLKSQNIDKTLVFAATKRSADELADTLCREGFAAEALHGDMRQSARNRTVARLKAGEVSIVVATDVAARGLDVKGISHVFNFDLPRLSEDYTHRIGRTGRAGAKGVAISFAYPKERGQVRRIETAIGHLLPPMVVPGFEIAMRDDRPMGGRNRNRQHREFRERRSDWSQRSDQEGRSNTRGAPAETHNHVKRKIEDFSARGSESFRKERSDRTPRGRRPREGDRRDSIFRSPHQEDRSSSRKGSFDTQRTFEGAPRSEQQKKSRPKRPQHRVFKGKRNNELKGRSFARSPSFP